VVDVVTTQHSKAQAYDRSKGRKVVIQRTESVPRLALAVDKTSPPSVIGLNYHDNTNYTRMAKQTPEGNAPGKAFCLCPARPTGRAWSAAGVHMVDIAAQDIPIPLSKLVKDFNPFEYFKDARITTLDTDREGFVAGHRQTKTKSLFLCTNQAPGSACVHCCSWDTAHGTH